jgi:hypothetical protein
MPFPSYSDVALVTDYNAYNASLGQDGVIPLDSSQPLQFGFGDSAQGYDAGLMPNSGVFVSQDPAEIAAYQDHARTQALQGVAKVGALVGGAALGGSLSGTNGATAGATSAPWSGELTAAGLPTGAGVAAAPLTAGAILPTAAGTGMNWFNIANIGSSLLGAYGANKAAGMQQDAANAAIAEMQRQYDQSRQDQLPWLQAGQAALGRLQDPNGFQASPDYAFRRSEGLRDIGNYFGARGGAFSGNALKALTEFNSGLASGEYGNWFNRQSNLAGLGQATGQSLGQLGASSAANVGNAGMAGANARASGIAGVNNAVQGGFQNWALKKYLGG